MEHSEIKLFKTSPSTPEELHSLEICRDYVEKSGLAMNVIRCEIRKGENKILFYFTSENRVDFRALVKDLAAEFHMRIELRQVGVRDESKLLGGLGTCGRPYCCSSFLDRFQTVSIKMAKVQGLSLNPTKISGSCGRLMCCLKYEQGAYEDAQSRLPKPDSLVETPDGTGTVTSVNSLRETVCVRFENASQIPRSYPLSDIRVLRSGKARRENS